MRSGSTLTYQVFKWYEYDSALKAHMHIALSNTIVYLHGIVTINLEEKKEMLLSRTILFSHLGSLNSCYLIEY